MGDHDELFQLRELIEAFPSIYSLEEVEEANTVARTRFEFLDNHIVHDTAELLKSGEIKLSTEFCITSCQQFHKYIFSDIIANNGKFRKESDPNNGRVFFGGQKRNEIQPEFIGTTPSRILDELILAFKNICESKPANPLRNAIKFYQSFVKIHPFYDGNGRISRLFVNLYLLQFNLYIDWKSLQTKAKFLKKLNRVHKTENEQDFKWLLKFCNESMGEISEEDIED